MKTTLSLVLALTLAATAAGAHAQAVSATSGPTPFPPPSASVGLDLPGVPVSVVRGVRAAPAPTELKPSSIHITTTPGTIAKAKIARGTLNRIVTPFAHVTGKTTSNADISTDEGVVYVATTSDDPIMIYLMEQGDPMHAIPLLLTPKEIGPVEISINTPSSAAGAEADTSLHVDVRRAAAFEQAAPFEQVLTSMMRALALGQVPDGFGLRKLTATEAAPSCLFQGLTVVPRQVVEGRDLLAYVAKVTNTTKSPIEIDETQCARPGVVAVGEWPSPLLQPGQSVELYIATRRHEEVRHVVRPSVLGPAVSGR